MGIGDYIWPFEKRFRDIPCARDAAIAGVAGGPITGALVIMVKGNYKQAVPISVMSGMAYFWLYFMVCRVSYFNTKLKSREFVDAIKTGKIE